MKDYSFGNYICALRMGRGLSQFQLGTLVGVTDKAVSKWENGDAKPRVSTCYRLAEVLGVSINELLSCEHYVATSAREEMIRLKDKLWNEAYRRLSIYGNIPPVECLSRLAAEKAALLHTDAIYGFAVMGRMQEELHKNNSCMTIAGTVNASFTAWLFGGTRVNPLKPHYRCPKCGNVEFSSAAADGFDLPAKHCSCGEKYIRDGHNLPFEGYAAVEQKGTHLEFRISEKAKPIAVRVLLEFFEGKAEILPVKLISSHRNTPVERYTILPKNKTKPTLSEDGFWHVSMDDYWEWQENETSFSFIVSEQLNELDRLNERFHESIPDPMELMTLEMAEKLYMRRCNKYSFFADRLSTAEKHDYDLILRIDGMSHSACASNKNGELLASSGTATLREIPATREDIWNAVSDALHKHNIHDNGYALQVMENARRGLYASQGMDECIRHNLIALGLPEWYPEYLSTIRYLFPKGHCISCLFAEVLLIWLQEKADNQ